MYKQTYALLKHAYALLKHADLSEVYQQRTYKRARMQDN